MQFSNSYTFTFYKFNKELEITVGYDYSFVRGVHTYSNGDPGHPDEEDFNITSIEVDDEDFTPVLDRIDKISERKKNFVSVYYLIEQEVEIEKP